MDTKRIPDFPEKASEASSGTHRDWKDKASGLRAEQIGKAIVVLLAIILIHEVVWIIFARQTFTGWFLALLLSWSD